MYRIYGQFKITTFLQTYLIDNKLLASFIHDATKAEAKECIGLAWMIANTDNAEAWEKVYWEREKAFHALFKNDHKYKYKMQPLNTKKDERVIL